MPATADSALSTPSRTSNAASYPTTPRSGSTDGGSTPAAGHATAISPAVLPAAPAVPAYYPGAIPAAGVKAWMCDTCLCVTHPNL